MKFQKQHAVEEKPNLTPMIDIIFQLLIFFVLTAKFIAFEGQLQAYLPKDRGLQSTTDVELPTGITLYLNWNDAGRVVCQTNNYQMEGEVREIYMFPDDENARQVDGGLMTETVLGPRRDGGKVVYDYAAPDFDQVEHYLKYRKDSYRRTGLSSKGLPVEVNFAGRVPWEMVVNIIDICTRLGITDLALSGDTEGID